MFVAFPDRFIRQETLMTTHHPKKEPTNTPESDRKKESVLVKPPNINDDWWDIKQRALKAREQGRKAREHLRATGKTIWFQ